MLTGRTVPYPGLKVLSEISVETSSHLPPLRVGFWGGGVLSSFPSLYFFIIEEILPF